jgi:hypothetical protein
VRFARTAVLLDENLVLFVDRVTADQQHTFDLVTHLAGKWVNLPNGESATLPPGAGYQHLKDATTRPSGPLTRVSVDSGVTLTLAGPSDVITATGVGKSTEDRVPAVIFRRNGQEATWVWAVSLDGKATGLRAQYAGDIVTARLEDHEVTVDFAKATVQVK